ncbi:MAG TPA: FCD domain-containing protein, partial [Sphaerochaeta sp.]|nr:FCD domain-containing protein [Sphaerochaeta sp.]
VRKALLQLEEEGIVERFAGRGAFIRKEVDADSIQLKLAKVDYQDLLEIKICIEQLAIRRAAERATDQQIAKLITIAEELVELADQGIFSVEHDRKFHLQLLECGGSTTLVQMVLSLIDSLNNFTNVLGGDAQEIWLKTIPYHMDIATALALREADHALAAHQYIYRLDIEALNKMAEQNQTI